MSLRNLSDREILSRIQELTRRERSLTLAVLLHLSEIERRRLHLKQGYASMFDYCTTGLGYSASAAARRIRTARCMARFPEMHALLESNEVNLSTVSQVSRVLSPENKDRLLTRIRGRSQREVDAIVAEYEPRSFPPDRIRPVVVRVPTVASAQAAAGVAASCSADVPAPSGSQTPAPHSAPTSDHYRSGSDLCELRDGAPTHRESSTVTEKRMLVSFSASEAFMAKLEKIRSLAWHQLPANPSLEQTFGLAMDRFIEKEDPSARRERREERKERSHTKGDEKREQRPAVERPSKVPHPRHVTAAVKDEVFTRDGGRCSYVGASGRRCASTRALQVDHINPIARGGRGAPGNLRLLCAFHNRLEAERVLGTVGYAGTPPTPPPAPGRGSSRATPP